MTGLSFARGELVFLIDCDLEEAPELLEYFYKEHSASCVDVVFGVQEKRKGDLFERISGGIFYMMFNWLSDVAIPKNVLTVRLMSKRYVASLLKHREREVFLAGLMHMAGFSQLPLAVNKEDKGQTSYTIWKKLSLMVNAITSFSNRPLVYIFHTGLLITLGAILYIAYTLVKKVVLGIDVPGWTTTILSIFVFSGVIILFQGVIGIYVAKIYIESKQRPYTIIRALYNCEETPEGRDEYISNH
jgi:putative glycosyltransferase